MVVCVCLKGCAAPLFHLEEAQVVVRRLRLGQGIEGDRVAGGSFCPESPEAAPHDGKEGHRQG